MTALTILTLLSLGAGQLPQDSVLAAVDEAWRPQFAIYGKGAPFPVERVRRATAIALGRNAQLKDVYLAILMSDAENLTRTGPSSDTFIKLGNALEKLNPPKSYQALKARLLAQTGGWGTKEDLPVVRRLAKVDAGDEQLDAVSVRVLMGSGTHADIDAAYHKLVDLRTELPALFVLSFVKAMCEMGEGSLHPERQRYFFQAASTDFRDYVANAPKGDRSVYSANSYLARLKKALP